VLGDGVADDRAVDPEDPLVSWVTTSVSVCAVVPRTPWYWKVVRGLSGQ
jgi:hypothetical protein